MFEREIQRAKELLTERLAAAQQFVYWQEIRERADIPVFYRNFFGAEVQWWIFEEQLQRAANPRFDYAHEQLAMHTVEADRYRMEAARFDHQDLTSAIDLAIKTRFNYILRPRTTLKWFVYRGEPTKTLSEVMLRMDYFLEYDYLLDGFRKWIAAKQSEAPTKQPVRQVSLVSVVEFDRTLQNVDNDVILEYSPEEFTDLLTPIFEMFDEIHAADRALQQYRGKVPMPAIIIFLDDKGIYRIAQELEEMMKTRALRYIGQREFLHLLNDIVNKLEHETPLPTSHGDTATLPITFDDDEPIIKADDTIGELAIGAAKRKPKAPSGLDASRETTDETSPLSDELTIDSLNTVPEHAAEQKTSEAAKSTTEAHSPALPSITLASDDNDDSSEEDLNAELAAAEQEYETTHTSTATPHHSAATEPSSGDVTDKDVNDELPSTFGTELAGLAAMMNNFSSSSGEDTAVQAPTPATATSPQPLQATLRASGAQAEIHDAEYVVIQPSATPQEQNHNAQTQDSSSAHAPQGSSKLANEALHSGNQATTTQESSSNKETEPPKSSLFARWSSIFSSRQEE
ncbi:MAG: hypothetical protein MUF71_14895 [Candidatus Kapabacteria bacterium]|jgi:hypothetical protein|nr:hypothetical protein [Candidatus Kapabacteria bacterium]